MGSFQCANALVFLLLTTPVIRVLVGRKDECVRRKQRDHQALSASLWHRPQFLNVRQPAYRNMDYPNTGLGQKSARAGWRQAVIDTLEHEPVE